MTDSVPEVQFILDAISNNWTGSETDIADVPLERIDRDNGFNLDSGEHVHADKPTKANLVGAASSTTDAEALGKHYEHRIQRVVNVRVQGAIDREHGEIERTDNATGPPQWQYVVNNVRRSILTDREFPAVADRPNLDYTWIEERNQQDLSRNWSDWYRWTADYVFRGFETLSNL